MRTILTVCTVCAAVTFAVGPPAHAGGEGQQFQSPSGNIACVMGFTDAGRAEATCDIGGHTYVSPPKPPDCHLGWGDRFGLVQDSAPVIHCHGDTLRVPGLPTLEDGQSRSVASITCDDEASGMTCTDNSTGHFFQVAPDSYQLG